MFWNDIPAKLLVIVATILIVLCVKILTTHKEFLAFGRIHNAKKKLVRINLLHHPLTYIVIIGH